MLSPSKDRFDEAGEPCLDERVGDRLLRRAQHALLNALPWAEDRQFPAE
jgi:hypothetical protein